MQFDVQTLPSLNYWNWCSIFSCLYFSSVDIEKKKKQCQTLPLPHVLVPTLGRWVRALPAAGREMLGLVLMYWHTFMGKTVSLLCLSLERYWLLLQGILSQLEKEKTKLKHKISRKLLFKLWCFIALVLGFAALIWEAGLQRSTAAEGLFLWRGCSWMPCSALQQLNMSNVLV